MNAVPSNSGSPGSPRSKPPLSTFWALNGVMFQGALSDNVYKLLLMMLVNRVARDRFADDPAAITAHTGMLQMIIEISFILPFMLAVTLAGWLSDRYSKTRVTRGTKLMEIGIMLLASMMFATGQVWGSIAILFLMGLQSALFSPSKYGMLPELLPENKVAWGNGILQGWTFLAIICGTLLGPSLYGLFEHQLWPTGGILVGLGFAGYGLSQAMKVLPAADPRTVFHVNPLPMIRRYGREILGRADLKWCILGMVVWWGVAVMLQGAAVLVAQEILHLSAHQTGLALLPIVIGLGVGCMATSWLSRNRIELGLVPFGAMLMCATCFFVWLAIPDLDRLRDMSGSELAYLRVEIPLLMGLVGLVCGLFIVPLQSHVVQVSDPTLRGGVWATSNVFVSLGMMAGAALKGGIVLLTQSPGDCFLVGGLLMLLTAAIICYRFPTIPLRFFLGGLFRLAYRTRVRGLENLPSQGGALIVANHQSYIDAILVGSLTERPIRFIMSDDIYNKWYIRPFAKLTRSIPISSFQSPRAIIYALREAREEIRGGGLVGIFPEGQMTRLGIMMPFRRGLQKIIKDLDEPIIPIAIDGAYDTSLALRGGRFAPRPRLMLPHRRRALNVNIGAPMPSNSSHIELRARIVELLVDAFSFRKADALPLHREAVASLRRAPFTRRLCDPTTPGMVSNLRLLGSIAAVGRRLRARWRSDPIIGVLLPPSVGAVAVNVAAALAGRTVVNLNYSASLPVLEHIRDQCRLRLVITSRVFLDKARLALPGNVEAIYLEDLRSTISLGERWLGMLAGWLLPVASLERMLGRTRPPDMDEVCTMVFSSGSTGIPKGVPLTHWNVWSNVTAAFQAFRFPPKSRLLGILPFFHSFGYTTVLWLPLMKSLGVAYYPSPLDGRAIGMMVERNKITHLLATPTFLSIYARRVQPGQFGSLVLVVAGAEKLRDAVADAFERRFGIRPIEGFGTTECSPVVSVNSPDYREAGICQQGVRRETVGHPIPGVCARVVDIETGEPLPPNKPGMLLVKGPNVMSGYYQLPEVTAEVLRDGWYVTGDVARMDEDGFITITDRLSRFSKIGGEMVPHIRIEETLHRIVDRVETVFAVTGVSDPAKGERLVVLYALPEAQARKAAEQLQQSDLPPLWIPKWNDFIAVEAIPVLGSGKLDLQKIKAIAREAKSAAR